MAHRGGGPAPRRADRPFSGGEDVAVSARQCGGRAARLCPGPLLHEEEFAAGMRHPRFGEVDDDLQRKNKVS